MSSIVPVRGSVYEPMSRFLVFIDVGLFLSVALKSSFVCIFNPQCHEEFCLPFLGHGSGWLHVFWANFAFTSRGLLFLVF